MPSYTMFIPAVMLSVAGHGLLLGFIALNPLNTEGCRDRTADPVVVHLADAPDILRAEHIAAREDTTEAGFVSTQSLRPDAGERGFCEDTIILGRNETPYDDYLTRLRQRIDREWRYPPEAGFHEGVGTVVIRFSISGRGDCTDALVLKSSGNHHLDGESLRAVLSAAPFEDLPKEYNLNRLNVIAEFNYGVNDESIP